MKVLTKARLNNLNENGFTVYYINNKFAFVRKWSKNSIVNSLKKFFRHYFSYYILVKIEDDYSLNEESKE